MTNRFTTSTERLAARCRGRVGEAITYTRGAVTRALTATLGSSVLRVTEPNGSTKVVRTDADFLVTATDMSTDFGEPERNDTITHNGRLYRVLSPGGKEPEWRYSDPTRIVFRIHTKLMES